MEISSALSQMFWGIILDAIEGKKPITPELLVWNFISNAGTNKRSDFLGNSDRIREEIKKAEHDKSLTEPELKAKYEEERASIESEIKKHTEFMGIFVSQSKAAMKVVRDAKISKSVKTGLSDILNTYAGNINDEIVVLKHRLVGFEEWKKNYSDIMSSKTPWLMRNLKQAEEDEKKYEKIITPIESAFQKPEGFKW